MAKKKTPAPRRAGTRDEIPKWLVDQLCGDPELLRAVAKLVREQRKRSPLSRLIRRR